MISTPRSCGGCSARFSANRKSMRPTARRFSTIRLPAAVERRPAADAGFFPQLRHKEAMTKIATPNQVLSFWKKAGPNRWFKSDPEFDHAILDKFLVTYQAAELGKLASWEDEASSALA